MKVGTNSELGDLQLGLESLAADPPLQLQGKRLGLCCNQASLDKNLVWAPEVIRRSYPGQLRALFAPQHGLWCEEQDNMDETAHGFDHHFNLPVHSLYAEQRSPTPEMLAGIDVLLVDLQDVGTRVYTFVWTLTYLLEACAQADVAVWVLDRPNPVGGELVEGPVLHPGFESFVGRASLPMRHGLTLGELALLLNQRMQLDCELRVVSMQGWQRKQLHSDLGRAWLPPSPNLPRFEGVLCYPGTVLLEGTELSEGRGTTTPFELLGAPWIDPYRLQAALEERALPGLISRPYRFRPTFQKFAGQACGGVFLHVTDPYSFAPYRTAVTLLACVKSLYPKRFAWRQPPYEYETVKLPIDILHGSEDLRAYLDDAMSSLWEVDSETYWREVREFLLY